MPITILTRYLPCIFFIFLFSHTHAEDKSDVHKAIVIHKPIVAITPPGISNTAGYFHIANQGNSDIRLLAVKSVIAERTEIHTHSMKNGVMKMEKLDSLVIPAQGGLHFQPGGHHIMFLGIKRIIKEGDFIEFTLVFSNQQTMRVNAKAAEPTHPNRKKNSHHHG